MSIPNSSAGGKISMKCIANEYGFCENTLPLSLDDLSNLIAKDRKHAMSEFSTCAFDDTASWLLIGGGGGSPSDISGAGGAGGYNCGCWNIPSLNGCSISVVIGGGGVGPATNYSGVASNGSNSCIFSNTNSSLDRCAGGGGNGGCRTFSSSCTLPSGNGNSVNSGSGGSGGGGGSPFSGYTHHIPGIGGTTSANGTFGNQGGIGLAYSAGGGGGSCAEPVINRDRGLGCRTIVSGQQCIFSTGGIGGENATRTDATPNTGNGGDSYACGSWAADPNNRSGNGGSGVFIVSYYSPTGATRMTGGDSVVQVNNRVVHTFNSSGTLNIGTVIEELPIEYLVVGSGGGVQFDTTVLTQNHFVALGGAGGGQVLEGSTTLCSNCQYTIVIGAGGNGVSANISRICTTAGAAIVTALGGQSICNTTFGSSALTASTVGESWFFTDSCPSTGFTLGACAVGVTSPVKGFQGGLKAQSTSDVIQNNANSLCSFFLTNNAFGGFGAFDLANQPQPTGGGGGAGGAGCQPTCKLNAATVLGCSTSCVYAKAGDGGLGVCSQYFGNRYGGGGGGSVLTGVRGIDEQIVERLKNGNQTGEFLCFNATRNLTAGGSTTIGHFFEFGCGTDGGGDGSIVPRSNDISVSGGTPTGKTHGDANSGGGSGGLSPFLYCGADYGSSNPYAYSVSSNGGSGYVAIRYPGTVVKATGGTITCSGGYVYHSFTGSSTFTLT